MATENENVIKLRCWDGKIILNYWMSPKCDHTCSYKREAEKKRTVTCGLKLDDTLIMALRMEEAATNQGMQKCSSKS